MAFISSSMGGRPIDMNDLPALILEALRKGSSSYISTRPLGIETATGPRPSMLAAMEHA